MFRQLRPFIVIAALSVFSLMFGMLGYVQPVQAAPAHPGPAVPVCPGPAPRGYVRCFSRVFPNASTTPTGLSPATIKSVYNFSTWLAPTSRD